MTATYNQHPVYSEPQPYEYAAEEYSPVKEVLSPHSGQGAQLKLVDDAEYGDEDESSNAMNDCHDDDDEFDEQRRPEAQAVNISVPPRR